MMELASLGDAALAVASDQAGSSGMAGEIKIGGQDDRDRAKMVVGRISERGWSSWIQRFRKLQPSTFR